MMIFQLWQGSFPFWQEAFLLLALQKHVGAHAGIKAFRCQHCECKTQAQGLPDTGYVSARGETTCMSSLCYRLEKLLREKKKVLHSWTWMLCRSASFVLWKGFLEKRDVFFLPVGSSPSCTECAKTKHWSWFNKTGKFLTKVVFVASRDVDL